MEKGYVCIVNYFGFDDVEKIGKLNVLVCIFI